MNGDTSWVAIAGALLGWFQSRELDNRRRREVEDATKLVSFLDGWLKAYKLVPGDTEEKKMHEAVRRELVRLLKQVEDQIAPMWDQPRHPWLSSSLQVAFYAVAAVDLIVLIESMLDLTTNWTTFQPWKPLILLSSVALALRILVVLVRRIRPSGQYSDGSLHFS